MEYYQVFILAIIQGLTEFLPVSSSAHLIIPSLLLDWQDQGVAFDVAVHVGTLFAVLSFYRQTIWDLFVGCVQGVRMKSWNDSLTLVSCIVLATCPAVVFALLLSDFIEVVTRSIAVIACTTIVFGGLLWFADYRGRNNTSGVITFKRALIIGFAQALALIPGTSRSGITITAALLLGLNMKKSAQFSFLLSIPLIVAAGLFKGLQLLSLPSEAWGGINVQHLLLGVVVSMLCAYACIKVFVGLVERVGMFPFVVYRFALGCVLLGVLYTTL